MHAHGLHPFHVSGHVRHFRCAGFPVAAIGIPPGLILRLPAVVHNHSTAAQFLGQSALLLNFLWVYLLMEAVPGGIHRKLGNGRHLCRAIPGLTLPPLLHVAETVAVICVSCIQQEANPVIMYRDGGFLKQRDGAMKLSRFFMNPGQQPGGIQPVG
ncbi:hypothetical protein D3C75_981940 [compost metagenome]